jgi:hypothetical protein
MGSLYRSQPMELAQLIVSPDNAYDTLAQLGELVSDSSCDVELVIVLFSKLV